MRNTLPKPNRAEAAAYDWFKDEQAARRFVQTSNFDPLSEGTIFRIDLGSVERHQVVAARIAVGVRSLTGEVTPGLGVPDLPEGRKVSRPHPGNASMLGRRSNSTSVPRS